MASENRIQTPPSSVLRHPAVCLRHFNRPIQTCPFGLSHFITGTSINRDAVNFILIIALLLTLPAWAFGLWTRLKSHLHILQLEDYSPVRLGQFLWKRRRVWLPGWDLVGVIMVIAAATVLEMHWSAGRDKSLPLGDINSTLRLLLAAGLFAYALFLALGARGMRKRLRSARKPLVMTARARRILLAGTGLAVTVFLALIASPLTRWLGGAEIVFTMLFMERMAGLWLAGAVMALEPFEALSRRRYLSEAQQIVKDVRPLVIGVTGSYGKTGTKELLSAMLSARYNVYRPPGSYNTLMGVTRAIREGLRPYHEAFVVEMGAYRKGSIANVCDLVQPQHGIITVIGIQHLERFGSQQAIKEAKSELIRALPPDGVAVLNGSDPLSREIGAAHRGEVIWFEVGTDEVRGGGNGEGRTATVQAFDLKVGPGGTTFQLRFPDGEVVSTHLSLLGRSGVANATAAAALADRLGIARRDIVQTLANMPPVRHRLERRPGENGITIIDDAFNSNPTGARDALEVLSMATGGKRILVTPGMIELGPMETEANRTLGRQAASACDLVLLIGGRRTNPIRDGLIEAGFPTANIRTAMTLPEGLEQIKPLLQSGDTMLFENDLPDQYEGL
ncbi:MAG: UDP-N-acetylmuramoyl-tripeptide--D-alanyl-D-alanine ligase [Calditrichaeota bacterium]|nr:UDP-N-acetylmuramoyl-tripeptide--D-alanyl-D-alanine ligase [Calditrichota bacterium]